jgi:hypothetical protein
MTPVDDLAVGLASRLGWDAGQPRLVDLVRASQQMLAGHVDKAMCAANPELWDEAVLGLAVKIAEAGSRGLVAFDESGGWQGPTGQATVGLVRSVWGLVQPLTASGGAIVV